MPNLRKLLEPLVKIERVPLGEHEMEEMRRQVQSHFRDRRQLALRIAALQEQLNHMRSQERQILSEADSLCAACDTGARDAPVTYQRYTDGVLIFEETPDGEMLEGRAPTSEERAMLRMQQMPLVEDTQAPAQEPRLAQDQLSNLLDPLYRNLQPERTPERTPQPAAAAQAERPRVAARQSRRRGPQQSALDLEGTAPAHHG
jgi:hypothetical protein